MINSGGTSLLLTFVPDFKHWYLELIWNLRFGTWCLYQSGVA